MSGPILALDLSSRTGWAVGRSGEVPGHGVWLLPAATLGLGGAFSALASSLEDALRLFVPGLIIMEAPLPPQAQTAMHSARLQFGLAAITEMLAHEWGVPCEEARATEVRRLVLGKGIATKAEVIAWCREQGLSPAEDNDADALVLLEYRLRLLAGRRTRAGELPRLLDREPGP